MAVDASRVRTVISHVVFALGVLCLLGGLFAGVVNREAVNSARFAAHVDSIRQDPAVARQLGLLVSGKIISASPELIALRPLVESVSISAVSSPAAGPAVRGLTASIHRSITQGDSNLFVLRLADLGAVTVAALRTVAPDVAARLPDNMDVTLSAIGASEWDSGILDYVRWVRVLAWLLPLLGLLLIVGAAFIRPPPAATGRASRIAAVTDSLGAAIIWLAALVAAILLACTIIASFIPTDTLDGALTVAVWREVDGRLWIIAAVAALIGLAVRAASSLAPVDDLDRLAERLREWVIRRPSTPAAIAARGGVLVLLGVLAVVRPLTFVTVVAVLLGAFALIAGAGELLRAANRQLQHSDRRQIVGRLAIPAVAIVGVAVLLATVGVLSWPQPTPALSSAVAENDPNACNGHVELCDRPYNDVAFPATHNSMSAADGNRWFLAEQETGVMGQLDDGVRVFLIDSWNGQMSNKPPIIANTQDSRAQALAAAEQLYGAQTVQSALRVRDALDLTPVGPVKPYLCHELCELGSTEWLPLMIKVREWMDAHPNEVVTFFVQDMVAPADVETLLRQAGLYDRLYTPTMGQPWPTLRQMIDSRHNLVWLHENVGGGTERPWLLDGKEWTQDTPYEFRTTAEFNCDRNRGSTTAPLFLVNHWMSNFTSRIRDAGVVNREEFLFNRLEQCRAERNMIPNFVAVNNYRVGDLFASVNRLNGVS
ncbi:hypothetical protein [Gordonia jacobaea]|uniref:hypothetical protein n=1 Tax=Gordonia jacobaea TaxID=122202 RepID=UPI003D731F79